MPSPLFEWSAFLAGAFLATTGWGVALLARTLRRSRR